MAAEERAAVGPPAAQACQEHGASDHRSIKLPDPVRPLMRGPTAASPTFPPLRRRVWSVKAIVFARFCMNPNHLPVARRGRRRYFAQARTIPNGWPSVSRALGTRPDLSVCCRCAQNVHAARGLRTRNPCIVAYGSRKELTSPIGAARTRTYIYQWQSRASMRWASPRKT